MKNVVYLDTNEAEIIRGMVYTILFEHGCEVSSQERLSSKNDPDNKRTFYR